MPRFRRLLGLLIALFPLLILAIVFTPAAAAPAADTVTVGNGHASDCTETNLGAAMNNNTDATIVFNCGGPATITVTQSGGLNVEPGKHFTIQGADVITLTGLSAHRLFYVQAGSALTLTHIVLTHGFDVSLGGAIRKDNSADLALDHVTLSDNQSLGSGGAINDAGGTLKATNSVFDHNTAGYGGAIFSEGTLSVTNSTFSNNSASHTGGALEVIGPATISGGQVNGNAAGEQGGALHINSSAVATVDHVIFDGNYTLTPTISLLYNGGAIHTSGPLTVTNSSFTRNSAVYGGALFSFDSLLYLANDTLSDNAAVDSGGAFTNADGSFAQVHDSTFSANSAASGGALQNEDALSAVYLYHTAVTQNTAGVLGGGLLVLSGTVGVFDQSSLSDNTAQAGGGAYVAAGGHLALTRATVSQNHATNANGGGLYIEHGAESGVDDSTLWGNTATGSGGAIDNESDSFSLVGSTLAGNTAGKGAGLYNTGSGASVDSSTLQSNAADVGGGLDNDANGALSVIQSTLAFNTASFGAGALNNGANAQLYFENSTLSGNVGTFGGALDSQGAAALLNVTVANNEASTGGGLYIEPGAHVVLTNTLLAYSRTGNCIGTLTAAKFSASSDNTCGLSDNINGHSPNHLDPLLTALGNYGGPTLVHMLKHNSPVLDGVVGNDGPLADQRGQPRPGTGTLGFDLGLWSASPPTATWRRGFGCRWRGDSRK